ncbi:hypothetical protein [Parerythrobacter lacustris]|uniref:DUF4440 domain-containing protein n=1 Tax=Parerythrobacter lacustris TaxID=2969984 RepID=A0ABT1XPA3_9SPHN|nr:hypothetical protein [Parerythrobacter lacustris]MCR2833500.1 hypothetical protein [Parerythrobacter lacustris]
MAFQALLRTALALSALLSIWISPLTGTATAQNAPPGLRNAISEEHAKRFIQCPDGARFRGELPGEMGVAERVTYRTEAFGGVSDADRLNGVTARYRVIWSANAERYKSAGRHGQTFAWRDWTSNSSPLGTVVFELRSGVWRIVRQDWRISTLVLHARPTLASCTTEWAYGQKQTPPVDPLKAYKERLVGKWAQEKGDCDGVAITFNSDGTVEFHPNGPKAFWRLESKNVLLMGSDDKWIRDEIDMETPGVIASTLHGTFVYLCG